jgi:hypothetical protein
MRSCCVDEKSQIQALERTQPSCPTPALAAGDIGAEQRLIGAVEGVADDRLGGGAAGLSTPQEVSQ